MTILLPRENAPIRPKKWRRRAPLRPRRPRDGMMYPDLPYTGPGRPPSGFGRRREVRPAGIVRRPALSRRRNRYRIPPGKYRVHRLQECRGPLAGQIPTAGVVTTSGTMPPVEKPRLGKMRKIAKKHGVSSKNAPILPISR